MSMKTKSKEVVDTTPRMQDNKWKTKYTTTELKELLHKNKRLNFIIDGMKVTVMPSLDSSKNHLVFINYIEQFSLRQNANHEDYKKWFEDWTDLPQDKKDIKNDWRYLLSLDWPEQTPKNVLWEYFETYLDCIEEPIEFTPFPDTYPDVKVKARTLFEAEHYARIVISVREQENKAENTIKTIGVSAIKSQNKSNLKKRREKNRIKRNKRLKTKNLHIENCKKYAEKQSEFRLVCLKHIPTNNIERIPKNKAQRLVDRDNGNYQIVPKYEWKRYIRKLKNDKPYSDGLHIIPSSGFPHEKSKYNGICRKDRRYNPKGRTHNHLVKKVFVPTVYETEVTEKEVLYRHKKRGEATTTKSKIVKEVKLVKEKQTYKSFYIEPTWEEKTITFYKYDRSKNREHNIFTKIHYSKPDKNGHTKIIYSRTNGVWGTAKIWVRTGYKKIPFVYEIEKPIIIHPKRTLHLLTVPKNKIKNEERITKQDIQ